MIYKDEIRKLTGNTTSALIGNTLAFGFGFQSLTIFTPTVGSMTSLSGFGKAFMAASPSLTGSLMRIPFGKNVGLTGGTGMATKFLILACAGQLMNCFSVTLMTMSDI